MPADIPIPAPEAVHLGPTDEEFDALIKPIWLSVKPGLLAQSIRSSLSVEFDDDRFKQWAADFAPEYVWRLVDIAAQRGMDARDAEIVRLQSERDDLKERVAAADTAVARDLAEAKRRRDMLGDPRVGLHVPPADWGPAHNRADKLRAFEKLDDPDGALSAIAGRHVAEKDTPDAG